LSDARAAVRNNFEVLGGGLKINVEAEPAQAILEVFVLERRGARQHAGPSQGRHFSEHPDDRSQVRRRFHRPVGKRARKAARVLRCP
jgi:hypothetical protein